MDVIFNIMQVEMGCVIFVSTRNDPLNTNDLTHITNKYLFYFRFVKYLLYPTYILNLKKK